MMRITGAILTILMLWGCSTTQGPQEQAGMVIGGVLGGMLGNEIGGGGRGETAAIIAGTMAGAAIGGAIGRSMDTTDRLRTGMALEGVRTGVTTTWRNPDTQTAYAVTPTRTFETSSGPCRDFTIQTLMEGRQQQVTGTACRQPDGTWRMQ
jgi:surface antigen